MFSSMGSRMLTRCAPLLLQNASASTQLSWPSSGLLKYRQATDFTRTCSHSGSPELQVDNSISIILFIDSGCEAKGLSEKAQQIYCKHHVATFTRPYHTISKVLAHPNIPHINCKIIIHWQVRQIFDSQIG